MTSTNSWRLIAPPRPGRHFRTKNWRSSSTARCQRNSCSTANSSSCGCGAHRRCGSWRRSCPIETTNHPGEGCSTQPRRTRWTYNLVVRIIRHLLPQMKQRGWGRLIQIGSGLASAPAATFAAYGSTKSAIVNLTVRHCQPPCQLHQLGQHPSGRRLRTDDELNTAPSTRRGTACGVVH